MEKDSHALSLAYQHVVNSGDAILAYDPEQKLCSAQEAMEWLEKIGMLYIDYQLLIATKRALIRAQEGTSITTHNMAHGFEPRRQPKLKPD